MKKFITNPITLIVSFLIILISGQQFGGFYLLYLFLGLSHGAAYAIAGILGTVLLILSSLLTKDGSKSRVNLLVNLPGVVLLWLSLLLFFYNDKRNYNASTFSQLIPQILLLFFLLVSISFFIANLHIILNNSKSNFSKSSIQK
jgi:hypothetical protein